MKNIDLDFKAFLEGRGGVVAGGAFGKFGGLGNPRRSQNSKTSFDDTNSNYQARIQAGKGIEAEIRDRLTNELGWIVKPSTTSQDMHDGIDGFITSLDAGKTKTFIPFQIKARKNTSGNDILWEAVKPWNRNLINNFENIGENAFTGKDMKCKAQYLISTSNNGSTIRIRNVGETISKAKKLVEALIQNTRATGNTWGKTADGESKVVKDPSQQANFHMSGDTFKVNCFIKPDSYEWKKDFTLKKPIALI